METTGKLILLSPTLSVYIQLVRPIEQSHAPKLFLRFSHRYNIQQFKAQTRRYALPYFWRASSPPIRYFHEWEG